MRVMTFNLKTDHIFIGKSKWDIRSEVVYEIFKDLNCDVVGAQEVNNNMYEDITKKIVDYNIIGNARSKRYFAERNNVFVKKDYNIINEATFWLSKKPEEEGSSLWYSMFPRICTTAIVDIDGSKVRVYNTHLDCLLPSSRVFGLKKITEFIEKNHIEEELPIILMGDFNASPHSKLIRDFNLGTFNKKKLVAVQEVNKALYEEDTFRHKRGKKSNIHIDYIYVSEEFEIKHAEIIKYSKNGVFPSDHYPLVADLELKELINQKNIQ